MRIRIRSRIRLKIQSKMCIPPGKILGTPLSKTSPLRVCSTNASDKLKIWIKKVHKCNGTIAGLGYIVHAKSLWGSRLVSALLIPIGEAWRNFSPDFNPNTNSSVLIKCKQTPNPHQATPSKILNVKWAVKQHQCCI